MVNLSEMSADPVGPDSGDSRSSGQHLATVSHGGRFWDVYLEFVEDVHRLDTCRALLCFSAADGEDEPVRTTTIIIEPSYEEAVARARRFEEHHLVGLLRSSLPD